MEKKIRRQIYGAILFLLLLGISGCSGLQQIYTDYREKTEIEVIPCQGIEPIGTEELPARYDSREYQRMSAVQDQGDLGTCWAFTALTALQSRLLPEEKLDFSEDHMSRDSYFQLGQNIGGEYTMTMAYLLSWRGPVLEEQDPYGDGVTTPGLKAVKHVQEIRVLPERDFEAIKRAVMQWGSVETSLYASLKNDHELSDAYRMDTYAYCCEEIAVPNHDVVVVGWDDNFSKDAFSVPVKEDGAFICQNSWGTGFGDQGYFYVSYEDKNIGNNNIVYSGVRNPDEYTKIWQTDACGWIGQMGYGTETAWAANVYQADDAAELCAAGFYAIDQNTDYEVYLVNHVGTENVENDLKDRIKVAEGHLDYAGYYTVPFAKPFAMEKGQRFAVVICLTTPGAVHPIAIEYDAEDGKCMIDLQDGEGYASLDGEKWDNAESKQNCNICLKAYGR